MVLAAAFYSSRLTSLTIPLHATKFYNKEKFENGYDPMWTDMLEKHAEKPFVSPFGC